MSVIKSKPDQVTKLRRTINPALKRLSNHPVYEKLKSINDLKIFMKYHSFAVWDFMSLVKALQQYYAPCTIPWFEPKHLEIARFINEIVLGEESDIDINGVYKPHYIMYLEAMEEIGSPTQLIKKFINEVKTGNTINEAIVDLNLPIELKHFLKFTFETIQYGGPHRIAAAFTFGREDIIPEMFLQVLENSKESNGAPKFNYYLERHIELDGDQHGPMALKLMNVACGDDEQKWNEAIDTAKDAIECRINLWSYIQSELS